jgi:YlmC/YmxH family sporulation protein
VHCGREIKLEVVRFSDLASKEVINFGNGKCLGQFSDCDLCIDPATGKIKEVTLAGRSGFISSFFTNSPMYVIPWQAIIRVGVDTIIVSIPEKKE